MSKKPAITTLEAILTAMAEQAGFPLAKPITVTGPTPLPQRLTAAQRKAGQPETLVSLMVTCQARGDLTRLAVSVPADYRTTDEPRLNIVLTWAEPPAWLSEYLDTLTD